MNDDVDPLYPKERKTFPIMYVDINQQLYIFMIAESEQTGNRCFIIFVTIGAFEVRYPSSYKFGPVVDLEKMN